MLLKQQAWYAFDGFRIAISALADAMAVEVSTAGDRFMSADKLEDSGTITIITNVGETAVKLFG